MEETKVKRKGIKQLHSRLPPDGLMRLTAQLSTMSIRKRRIRATGSIITSTTIQRMCIKAQTTGKAGVTANTTRHSGRSGIDGPARRVVRAGAVLQERATFVLVARHGRRKRRNSRYGQCEQVEGQCQGTLRLVHVAVVDKEGGENYSWEITTRVRKRACPQFSRLGVEPYY